MMLLHGVESEQLDRLMERLIDREDPNAMLLQAVDQACQPPCRD